MPNKITNCEHTDRKYFAKGRCKVCYYRYNAKKWYQRNKKKRNAKEETGSHLRKPKASSSKPQSHIVGQGNTKVPLWKIVKLAEEGKTQTDMKKELGLDYNSICLRLKRHNIKVKKETGVKTYKKLARIGKWGTRIISISKHELESIGINPRRNLFCRIYPMKASKVLALKVVYEIPKGGNDVLPES